LCLQAGKWNTINLKTVKWTEWSSIAPHWESLWMRSAEPTPFLHPAWVESWLQTFGPTLQPTLLTATSQTADNMLGCCVITRRVEYLHSVPIRRIYLNMAGENSEDDVCIEYNDVVAEPEYKSKFVAQLIAHLKQSSFDQMLVNGVCNPDIVNLLQSEWDSAAECRLQAAPYINLALIREKQSDCEKELSSNTRAQVRRSRKLLEAEHGALKIERANTVAEGREFMQELASLHQLRWTTKGEPGAFHSPRFSSFHQRLVERLLPIGEIDLLRVRSGDHTVGILYNYIINRKVFFYQSGFAYTSDNRIKPGVSTHVEAANYYLNRGLDEYDFLAGDSQYKQSLSNAERQMKWLTFNCKTMRMKLIGLLKNARSRIQRAKSENHSK
jgi:CelD/BcsL family acetyltransferase involved in cellulose biosynthesis